MRASGSAPARSRKPPGSPSWPRSSTKQRCRLHRDPPTELRHSQRSRDSLIEAHHWGSELDPWGAAARGTKALIQKHHRYPREKHARTEHVEWMASAEGELEADARQRDQIKGFQEIRHSVSTIRVWRARVTVIPQAQSLHSGQDVNKTPATSMRGEAPRTMWPMRFRPRTRGRS